MPKLLPPIHPGEHLLEDFMKPLDLSRNALARELRVPPQRIPEIVQCRRSISADTALRLAQFFGTTPQFWLNQSTPTIAVRNGLQIWYLKSERMPGYTDYYIGPLDDDDLVERLEEEFRKAEMSMNKQAFPRPK